MDSIASASVRHGSVKTRELLFRPMDLKLWLSLSLHLPSRDPRMAEMRRLLPYYRGTRLLVLAGLLLMLPAFLIPFTEPFIGFSGAIMLVILYVILIFVLSIVSLLLEASLDAIFAIAHEEGVGFSKAARTFINFSKKYPGNAMGYMGAKLLVDMGAMTVISLLFLPALFAMVFILSSVLHTLEAGQAVSRGAAFGGLAAVAVLCAAALTGTMLISMPLSAFYGYYTEEAVRRIRKA